jgi:CRP/FNR family transcriptional regulator
MAFTDSRACVVEALETTSVCELPTDFLKQLLAEVPAARLEMLKNMSAQVHSAEELIRVIETKRTDQRLAVFLLEMSQRAALRGLSDQEIRLTMHTDLASFLEWPGEHWSRALSRFDTEGTITGRVKSFDQGSGRAAHLGTKLGFSLAPVRVHRSVGCSIPVG